MTHTNPHLVGRAHDVLRQDRRSPFDALFAPKSVAVVGAREKEGSVGRAVMENLACFSGRIFPVNPKRPTVLGRPAFASLSALPESVDLAVLVTPAQTVPNLVRECVARQVPATIIISAGFKEIGPKARRWNRRFYPKPGGAACVSSAPIAWARCRRI